MKDEIAIYVNNFIYMLEKLGNFFRTQNTLIVVKIRHNTNKSIRIFIILRLSENVYIIIRIDQYRKKKERRRRCLERNLRKLPWLVCLLFLWYQQQQTGSLQVLS